MVIPANRFPGHHLAVQYSVLAVIITAFFLAACQPSSTHVAATLPVPQVNRAKLAPSPVPPVSPTARDQTKRMVNPGSLAEISRSTYGERLIEWIRIPGIGVLAPVIPVGWHPAGPQGESVEWDSPEAGAGWVVSSVLPGDRGNIILYGHNNINASVFKKLGNLKVGDAVILTTGTTEWRYQVVTVEIFPVVDKEQDTQAYQKYFKQTADDRLTLLSCWPPVSNTHRVVVIALPVQSEPVKE